MLSFSDNHPHAQLICHAVNVKTKAKMDIFFLPVFGFQAEGSIRCETPEEILWPHEDEMVKKHNLLGEAEFKDLVQIAI